MFKRYEHSGHVLLHLIPLRIYKFCLFQFSQRLFGSPNVHSTLRSMNRERVSRRSSTVGPGFIVFHVMSTHQGKLCGKNLDEALYILKGIDHCPIEIIKGSTDKGQFQYLTNLKGPQVGNYLYTTQSLSLC